MAGDLGADNGWTVGRAYVAELTSPHPLGASLPALYQEDDFAQRWTAGLDLVLAPIFNAIDNFEAYIDPRLAPADFLDWIGAWMGLIADETWPLDRRRAFISRASELYRMRGTPRGLAAHVEIFSGGEVEVVERGGVAWSTKAGAALPGSTGFDILVRVRVDDPAAVDASRLDAMVAAAKPAHLTHRVEVVAKTKVSAARRSARSPIAEVKPEPEGPTAESEPPVPGADDARPDGDGSNPT